MACGRRKWTAEIVKEEALKYSTRSEFKKESSGAHTAARRLGILDDVRAHMKRTTEWTELAIREEALK